MKRPIRKTARGFRTKSFTGKLTSIVAMLVVFTTTYMMILPAIAIDRQAAAGSPGMDMAAGETAEGQIPVLDCPFIPHAHTEECYVEKEILDSEGNPTGQKEKILVCGKVSYAVHVHDASCYQDGVLVCTLPEYEKHEHDDSCYEVRRTLVCTEQEHTHTDACYEEVVTGYEQQLVCGYNEGDVISPAVYSDPVYSDPVYNENGELVQEPVLVQDAQLIQEEIVHHHTESCYAETPVTERQLICTLPEHVHSDSCYAEEKVLICDKPELHTHTEACYEKGPNGETPEEMGWIHYEEKDGQRVLVGDPTHRICGKNELLEHVHTDACFHVEGNTAEDGASGENASEDNAPEDNTLEDNTSEENASAVKPMTDKVLKDVNADDEEDSSSSGDPQKKADEADMPAQDFHAETATMAVSVTAEAGTFPAGTTMRVEDVEDTNVLDSIRDASAADDSQIVKVNAVDITFYTAEGEEIEPEKPVSVIMKPLEDVPDVTEEGTGVEVIHVSADGEAAVVGQTTQTAGSTEQAADSQNAENAGNAENAETAVANAVTFEASSFSVYALVYTVDFHYEINGKMYDFSIPGGGFVSLEHVVEVLGIATADENTENGAENAENGAENSNDFVGEVPGVDVSDENATAYEEAIQLNEVKVSEATKRFVADVESVEFSSPELVWVGKVENESTVGGLKEANGLEVQYSAELTEEQITEINAQTVEAGDWALISVQPFDTEEMMTVTMKDGEVFTVKVTDAQISTNVIIADGSTYRITVTYGSEAGIPEGAILEAEEIEKNTIEWNIYYQQSADTIGKESLEFARFFDVRIMADGEKIEPQAPVETKIEYESGILLNPDSDPKVIHFTDSGSTEVLEVRVDDEKFAKKFTFEQDSFSVIGTVASDLTEGNYLIYGYRVVLNNNQSFYDESYSAYWDSHNITSLNEYYYSLTTSLGSQELSNVEYGRAQYTGNNNSTVLWKVEKTEGGYLISNGSNYLRVNNGALSTGNRSQASVWTYVNGQLKSGNYYLKMRYQNRAYSFYLDTAEPTGANIYLAWDNNNYNSSITIHYGTLNGAGQFIESSSRSVSNPTGAAQQINLRKYYQDCIPDGKQFVKAILVNNGVPSTGDPVDISDGTDIYYFLQTNYGSTDTANSNRTDLIWLYRELTSAYYDYGDIGWQYWEGGRENVDTAISQFRTFPEGQNDIYIIYRDEPSGGTSPSEQEDIDAPSINKGKFDNDDGTYDIALSVEGQAADASRQGRANVVVLYDNSYSMLATDGSNTKNRLGVCNDALEKLAEGLFAYNEDDSDTIEMALVTFAQRVLNEQELNTIYHNKNDFMNAVNGVQTSNGTNWDAALDWASAIQWNDNDPLYVILVSDGEPNGYANRLGSETGSNFNGNYTGTANAVTAASARVMELIQTYGATVYAISAFYSDTTNYLYDLPLSEDVFNATTVDELDEIIQKIIVKITSTLGYQNVVMTDGLTGMTQTALVNGNAGNFTYTVAKYN